MKLNPGFIGILVAYILIAPPLKVWADDLSSVSHEVGGRTFFSAYLPVERTFNRSPHQTILESWIALKSQLTERHRTFFEFAGRSTRFNDYYPVDGRQGADQNLFYVREGYYRYSEDGLIVKFGQQITPWGKADGLNPTDFLTATDQSRMYSDPIVKRKGAPAISLDWTPKGGESNYNHLLVVQLLSPQNVLALPNNQIQQGVALSQDNSQKISKLSDTEWAYKGSYSGDSWDADLIAFYGFNKTPFIDFESLNLATGLSLKTHAQRILGLGTNWSVSHGSWTTRFEGSYSKKISLSDYDGSLSKEQIQTVVSTERKLGENWRIQSSLIYRDNKSWQHRTSDSPNVFTSAINNRLYELNRVLQGENVPQRLAELLRVSYEPLEESYWKTELSFIHYGLKENSNLFQSKTSYQWQDNTTVAVGALLMNGRPYEPLGFLHNMSSFFVELSKIY